MAIQDSGTIKFSEIQTEFGGSNPISISEYYRDGNPVPIHETDIPSSGEIDISDFYGTGSGYDYTIDSNQKQLNLATWLTSEGWNGTDEVSVLVDDQIYIWSDSTSVAALTIPSSLNNLLSLHNDGYIMGKGGRGGDGGTNTATNGGPAISNSATGVVYSAGNVEESKSGYIGGGGGGGAGGKDSDSGGGGGGAGGGNGGDGNSTATGGAGGAVGASGSDGGSFPPDGQHNPGQGGSSGGGGANYDVASGGAAGGGGGRILPGGDGPGGAASGDAGFFDNAGTGGASGVAGGSISTNTKIGAGGGGWGAAGGSTPTRSGGSAGAAVTGTAFSSMTYYHNSATYGSTPS